MEFKSMLKHFSNNISKTRDILLAPQWICREMGALKIEKICSSPKVIQPCVPKSDSAPPGAIWAKFEPKKPQ